MARALLILLIANGCVVGLAGTRDPDGGLIDFDSGRRRDGGVRDSGEVDPDAGMDFDAGMTPRETICDDGIDQDDDGRIDCEDLECDGATCDAMGRTCIMASCGGCRDATTETACGDGADEDCDGLTDCADSDCNGMECSNDAMCSGMICPGCPSGFVERMCGDSTDDDCDNLSDCADPDCMGLVCGANGERCFTGGTCMCPGSVELCNDIDDDCSGAADDGCPRSVATCCDAPGTSFGSTDSGTVFSDPCPANTLLIGIAGRESATRIDQIQPICAALVIEVDRETSPDFSYTVRRSADIRGATHGGGGGTPFEDRCPNNELAIGIVGDGTDGVTSVALQCGAATIDVTGARQWRITVTPTTRTPERGGPLGTLGGNCAAGSVVTELNGRASTTLHLVGTRCQRLELSTI
jgi:hypothetical protein